MNKEILERANKIFRELEQAEKLLKALVDTSPATLVNFIANNRGSIDITTRENMKNMLYTYFTNEVNVLRKKFKEVGGDSN